MDDFLGTSIQYSEQQIKLLEKEYAKQKAQEVEELINSGFLDSDYEESTDSMSEYTESDLEIENNINYDLSSSSSPASSPLSISSKQSEISSDYIQSPSSSDTSIQYNINSISNRNNLALVLSADISAIKQYILHDIMINNDDNNGINDNDIDQENEEYEQYQQYKEEDKLYQHESDETNTTLQFDFVRSIIEDIKWFAKWIICAIIFISFFNISPNVLPQQQPNYNNCNILKSHTIYSSTTKFPYDSYPMFNQIVINNFNPFRNKCERDDEREDEQEDEREEYHQQQQHKKDKKDKKVYIRIQSNFKNCNNNALPSTSPLVSIVPIVQGINNRQFKLLKETMQIPVGSKMQGRVIGMGLSAFFLGICIMASSISGSGDDGSSFF